jgi:ABC-type nitrate/sulfonate/bicarbonate transport system substrate-binding protein
MSRLAPSRIVRQNRAAPRPASVRLRVGFVPLCDCAPLVVALEHGLFRRNGLAVGLSREIGWATILEKLVHGQLDAVHALAAMPLAATLGLGSVACPSLTALVLNRQGNAITLARSWAKLGVTDARSFGQQVRHRPPDQPLVFGIVSPVSSHRHLIELWLAQAGLVAGRHFHLAVVPPPQMPAHLKAGHLAGYCVGEPWNSVAIESGLGWCPATSADLAAGHPEKVLMVREHFAEEKAKQHLRLEAAVAEACNYCAEPANHDDLARLLARPEYVNAPASLIRRSFSREFKTHLRCDPRPERLTLYAGDDVNVPTPALGQWILRHLIPASATAHLDAESETRLVRATYRSDLFEQACAVQTGTAGPSATPRQTAEVLTA